jgi:plasmid stabilization system protein ParE
MYYVKITDTAEEDILSSVKYIADVLKAPKAAINLLDEIKRYTQRKQLPNLPCGVR